MPAFSMKRIFASSLLAIAVFSAWLTIFILWPIPFWQTGNDYVYLSLAHAIHFETALHETVNADPALANHPGIPFYVASWLALRGAAFSDSGNDIVRSALAHPDRFFVATKIIGGLITAAGIGAAWLLLRGIPAFWRCLAILSFFAAAPASYRYGLVFLGNETFALPLAVLLFWAVDRCAKTPPEANFSWLLLGAAAALGYTVKLLYLDLLVAALAVALIDSWWNTPALGLRLVLEFSRRIALILIAFFVVTGSILLTVLGHDGLNDLLRFHSSIFTHSGIYGSGDIGFVSTAAVHQALLSWFAETALPYLIPLAAASLCVVLGAKFKAHTLDRRTALAAAGALAAILSASAAILKHFDSHYVVAICALLPFVLSPVFALRRTKWIAAAGILACLGWTTFRAGLEFSKDSKEAAAIIDDEAEIRAMPLAPGEARLWTYRVPTQEFAAAFVASYSGVGSIMATLADPARQDFSSYSMVKRPYRYIVLDRKNFPDANAVRKVEGSLDRTQALFVPLAPDDKIHELRRLIVVEKPAP
jgi:hypothetical protein